MAQTANDHCRKVLAAIIPKRRDLLDTALKHLTIEHFPDATLRNVYVMLTRYADVTGAVISRAALSDLLKDRDEGTVLLYEETYDQLAANEVDESEFRWSLQQVRELAAERATLDSLQNGMEILSRGLTEDKGREWKGHQDARAYVMQAFAEAEKDLRMQDAPEGNLRHEAERMMADYAERQKARTTGRGQGVLIGIEELDRRIGGLQPGELDLFCGYASSGKTTLSCQTSWHAVVEQGLNVCFLTTETLRPQVSRKILARHSKHPMFGLADGLNTRDLKNGSLEPSDEAMLQKVVDDFTKNPSYGNFYLAQLPRGSTVNYIESMLYRVSRMWHIDLVVIDYLALMASERRRQDQRQEMSDIMKSAKQMAATFDDGAGVPVISPWQVNRASYEEALKSGFYTLKALSDTAEAEKSADVVVSMLGEPKDETRHADIKAQILKNRDGERASSIELTVDFATCTVASKITGGSALSSLVEL